VNVASPNLGFRRRSVELARATVRLADAVGAQGVVVHAGSGGAETDPSRGLAAAAASLVTIADAAERTRVLVELTAGGAGSIASTFREARALFEAAGMHERLGLCADTCHLFAAGYALDTSDGAAACFRELQRVRLAGRLRLIHANDSAFGRGEHRDRHANVGRGFIGAAGFRAILSTPAIRRCAVVCETPGTAEDRARDIRKLRDLAGLEPPAGTRA
jgi:deoxyribonuclease-4